MRPELAFRIGFRITCFLIFIVVAIRNFCVPFSHDEAATFMYYIQSGDFMPFAAHVDANGHFLTSALGWICFKLFGSSEFALRLPNLIGLLFLFFAVSKVNRLLDHYFAKILLSSLFLLCYNFLCFYSLCRGYALSMSFLLLASAFFMSYLKYRQPGDKLCFMLFMQLGLSANLTLLVTSMLLAGIVILHDLLTRTRPKWYLLLCWAMYFSLVYFWARYAFFLQDSGALYYGGWGSYWEVTFKTLIETLFFKSMVINALVLTLFGGLTVYFFIVLFREKMAAFKSPFVISSIVLVTLIVGFFMMKLLINVNFPEDRTGLFFYVFFVLAMAFMVDQAGHIVQKVSLIVPALMLVMMVVQMEFEHHPWVVYETMPRSFHKILEDEQKTAGYPVTVAGHRVRELIYGFANYNATIKTSHMTSPEALQMNCDYAVAYEADDIYYKNYYVELARDEFTHFRLLKRRKPLERTPLAHAKAIEISGSPEYVNAFEILDTTFESANPLEAEFDISIDNAPVPFNAWLVVQVDGVDEKDNILVRTPLNLVNYNWNGVSKFRTRITTGNVPLRAKRIVCYLWNIDKKEVKMHINNFELYQLHGIGVKVISHAKI